MRKILFLTAMFAFILTASSWAADISGNWTISWWGAGAEESFPVAINAAGENLTLTGTHPSFGEMTGTGTLKGDSVALTLKSSSMEIGLTGKLAGDKMSGTREIKASGDGRGGGDAGGAPGGAAPQGGMPEGAPQGGMSGGPGGGQGPAPDGQGAPAGGQGAPQGGAPGGAAPQGGMSAGSGAPQGGGSDAAGGNENWTAVRN